MSPHYLAFPLLFCYAGLIKNRKITKEDWITPTGLRAKIFYPSEKKNLPGIYLQHGMSVLGIDDQRIAMLAESLAYSGYSVVLPEFPEVKGLRFELSTIDNIQREALQLSQSLEWYNGKKFGYFSVSFSSGLGLVALCRDKRPENLLAFMGIGGYANFQDTYPFVFQNYDKDNYGVMVLFYNFYEGLEPKLSKELKPIFWEAAMDNAFLRNPPLVPTLLEKCSKKAKEEFLRITGIPEYRWEVASAMKKTKPPELMLQFSPVGQVARCDFPISLLHGVTDPVIAPQESQVLFHHLKSLGKKVVFRTSSAIVHGDQLPLHTQIQGIPGLLLTFGSFLSWMGK